MKKRILCFLSILLLLLSSENIFAESVRTLSITGAVKQPLTLTMEDIKDSKPIRVLLNEITRDNKFKGIFSCQGVPLKTLVQLACIDKGKTDFSKHVDLTILIKNKKGQQTVLSWGEVFFKNPGEIIIAYSASPVMPHKDCKSCHAPEVYKPWLSQLERDIGFPKLVMTADIYSDRSMEEITEIKVVDLKPKIKADRSKDLFSPGFTIIGSSAKPVIIKSISDYPMEEIYVKVVGEGKGYHGTKKFKGTPFMGLLKNAKINMDINTVFIISAPDGYRSLLSYGEIFFSPVGDRIIIANRANGQEIKKGGKFCLVLPDDFMADRWVKAVEKIEVISFKQE